MCKLPILALTLSCLVGMLPASAVAQDNSGNQPQSAPAGAAPEHWRGHGQPDPAKRTEMLTKQLGLTSDQQPKVLDILKSEQSQMEKLHSDSSTSPEDRRAKMMDIHKSTNDQIRALLNPDQQKKWDEMQTRREQWQGHHREGQNSGGAPDSSNPN
jgi:periplasmic protein CpxP/Spy